MNSNFWNGYTKKGFFVGIILLALYLLYLTITGTIRPQPTCVSKGDVLPPKPEAPTCSIVDCLASNLNYFTVTLGLMILLIPILIGFFMHRYKNQ